MGLTQIEMQMMEAQIQMSKSIERIAKSLAQIEDHIRTICLVSEELLAMKEAE